MQGAPGSGRCLPGTFSDFCVVALRNSATACESDVAESRPPPCQAASPWGLETDACPSQSLSQLGFRTGAAYRSAPVLEGLEADLRRGPVFLPLWLFSAVPCCHGDGRLSRGLPVSFPGRLQAAAAEAVEVAAACCTPASTGSW